MYIRPLGHAHPLTVHFHSNEERVTVIRMPKKKKGGKKKGESEIVEVKDKDGDRKPYETPGASEKETTLRAE